MEHNRKQKLLMIIALVVGIASLSIGFAAFSTTLNISSSASVTPSSDTFSVKFSTNQNSLVVNSVAPSLVADGVTASNGIIDNSANPTITNLTANFTKGFQYVNYTFYARNEGEYNAYLNGIYYIGDNVCVPEEGTSASLVESACNDFHILVTVGNKQYSDTSTVTGHMLEKGKGEVIVVRIEYASGGTSVDGPFSVTFPNISLIYSTVDDSSIKPNLSEKVVKLESGNLNDPGSIVSIEDEQFYVFGQEDGNVKLLSMYNLHVGNSVDKNRNVTPLSNPTGIQDETAIGYNWDSINEVEIYPFIGTTVFSKKGSTYSGSIVEGYVNNYAAYLESIGANIETARLITKEELEELGCTHELLESCVSAPEWIYATSYWLGSTENTGTGTVNALFVISNGEFSSGLGGMSNETEFGVRPVIEISLSEF